MTGLVHGAHRSLSTTSNIEFADYKEYSPGDNLRDLDWKVAARSDRWVVRRHHAESHLPTTLLFDASGDLGTGTTGRYQRPPLEGSKFGYAVTLAASLGWFLSRDGDPLGLMVTGGEEPGRDAVRWPFVPPRSGRSHLSRIIAQLAAIRPAGEARLGEAFTDLGHRLGRRSMVVIISDLMEEPATWGPALTALARRQVDLRVVHLYDPQEWSLDYGDMARFQSPEGGAPVPLDPGAVQAQMAEVVGEYLGEVRAWLSRHRGVHVLVPTDAPLELALARVLNAQAGEVGTAVGAPSGDGPGGAS